MQNFYAKLHKTPQNQTTYLSFLAGLTQASRNQMSAWYDLPMGWGTWGRG